MDFGLTCGVLGETPIVVIVKVSFRIEREKIQQAPSQIVVQLD